MVPCGTTNRVELGELGTSSSFKIPSAYIDYEFYFSWWVFIVLITKNHRRWPKKSKAHDNSIKYLH